VPYGLDYAFRFFKSRFVTATIRPMPSLSSTRIEVPSLNSGWRAGQHVRIRIFSTSLGWLGWTESHPFTIASAPVISSKQGRTVGEEGLILICKNAGGWTRKLYDMAKKSGYIEAGIADGVDIGKTVAVMIEGPYSGPGHAIYASYSGVVMMVGGSGITFALSIIQDLVQKDLQAQSRVKVLELIWMVASPDAMVPLMPLFTALVESCASLSISVHYTRAYAPRPNKSAKGSSSKVEDRRGRVPSNNSEQQPLFPVIPQGLRISLSAGRPSQADLVGAVEGAITRTVSIGSGATGHEDERGINGVLVGVCGPAGLGVQANLAVNSIDSARKQQAGGVDVYEEYVFINLCVLFGRFVLMPTQDVWVVISGFRLGFIAFFFACGTGWRASAH
jgi:ferric-chelate reductase